MDSRSSVTDLDEVVRALDASAVRMAAVATVVRVRGSAYRREGARLVVPAQGASVGVISPGCLEAEVVEVAHRVLGAGRARLLTLNTDADTEALWGWGLGCGAVIDVLVEPPVPPGEIVPALRSSRNDDRALVLVSAVHDGQVIRTVVKADGSRTGDLGDSSAEAAAVDAARRVLVEQRSRWVSLVQGWDAFIEVLEPCPRLVVCGADVDAGPLVELGRRLGWRVTVVDHRRAMLDRHAFWDCDRLVVTEPRASAERLGPNRRTFVIVMTHNFFWDMDYLRSFLPHPLPYLGVLGPSARMERLIDELRRDGVELDHEALRGLRGPAGLDIGAEGAEEIALAVMAEVTAVRRGASWVERALMSSPRC